MRSRFDWNKIRRLREAGHSAYSIAQTPDMPSRQAISQRERKESWQPEGELQVRQAQRLGLCNDDNKGIVIAQIARGASYRLAAACVGVADRTLRDWRAKDSDFAAACDAAKACLMVDQVNNIVEAGNRGDWRASAWLVERSDATRADYRTEDRSDEPIRVVLQIDRGD